ncbi:hypothetical protein P153DRAFT_389791 [Dothidotthia symphoricarpi CBS 119687]|uniref:Uncharacterized protein n=1 Tax=Dothidotthia symphoricarpi CBS 119687 TaxID=1392245 RepID=A0A6A5ZYW9_9PLEO|nr:uncharacterized protein P153DRAFT_389791 [Dothidotthia symphoricarpi CBS 119687]KAF2124932.1 hypothetical protein P153DRAFT_389791 [Dothidotthia symphoricarpi CBS 119687]
MTWWRHDSSLWSRSPINRYAQRILRDNEAALRTRGFSRTLPKSAHHEEPSTDKKCPEGMSNSEWRQLQQYKLWRKRLQEDPYKALFGASEDMLSGKGLKDWDWVYKSFPKWMLNDVDVDNVVRKESAIKRDGHACDYGNRAKLNQEPIMQAGNTRKPVVETRANISRTRGAHFPEPCIRTTHYERDDFGIVSPSDLRRPREQSHVTVAGNVTNNVPAHEFETTATKNAPYGLASSQSAPSASTETHKRPGISSMNNEQMKQSNLAVLRDEAAARESTFIDEFLSMKSEQPEAVSSDEASTKSWRQTTLQRRVSIPGVVTPGIRSATEQKGDAQVPMAWHVVPKNFATPPSDAAYKVSLMPEIPKTNMAQEDGCSEPLARGIVAKTDRSLEQDIVATRKQSDEPILSTASKSTSEKLSVLPEDDIDFLSAADIRASMAGKRASVKGDIGKQAKLQALEERFLHNHQNVQDIDSMVESKTINDQLVRRTERHMRQLQEEPEAANPEPEGRPAHPIAAEPHELESSVGRMKRWLEEGGATLSKHFWQDPTPEGASELALSKAYFDKILARIQKGRSATKHIAEDLERDVPACKQLLKRLKDDEEMLDQSTSILRRRSMEATTHASTPVKLKDMQTLRWKFERTEHELSVAYTELSELEKTGSMDKVGELFKRRLRQAATVCHKNSKLTRSLLWSLQGRLEDSKVQSHVQAYYRIITHRLLTLRDTQLALAQLVDRAMQLYGVTLAAPGEEHRETAQSPKTEDLEPPVPSNTLSGRQLISTSADTPPSKFVLDAAADAHLAGEVQAQKFAMQGLSDDGYSRAPKVPPKRIFDEPSPLANSLFRPFGLQLQSLGQDADVDPEVERLKENAKRKLGESKLVNEVRKAYEDVYGPITVDHKQVAVECEDAQSEESEKQNPGSSLESTLVNQEPVVQVFPLSQSHDISVPAKTPTDLDSTLNITTTSRTDNTAVEASASTTPSENSSPSITTQSSLSDTGSSTPSPTNLHTHYTILIHNPQTDTLTITRSTTSSSHDPSPIIPIHQALSTLDSPAKFIPHIVPSLEIVTAKRDMLVLRDCGAETKSFSTTSTSTNSKTEDTGTERMNFGPNKDLQQFFRGKYTDVDYDEYSKKWKQMDDEVRKRRVGGVFKAAIYVTATCYVVGVLGELYK